MPLARSPIPMPNRRASQLVEKTTTEVAFASMSLHDYTKQPSSRYASRLELISSPGHAREIHHPSIPGYYGFDYSTKNSGIRIPHWEEEYYMREFASHVEHCPLCSQTLKTFKPQTILCFWGSAWARGLAQYICPINGVPISIIEREIYRRQVQVLLPRRCGSVNALLRALELGLKLEVHPSDPRIATYRSVEADCGSIGGLRDVSSAALVLREPDETVPQERRFGPFQGFEGLSVTVDGSVTDKNQNRIGYAMQHRELFIGLKVDESGFILNESGVILGQAVRYLGTNTFPASRPYRIFPERSYSEPAPFTGFTDRRGGTASLPSLVDQEDRVFNGRWYDHQSSNTQLIIAPTLDERSRPADDSMDEDIDPSYASQRIRVWSNSLVRLIPTIALLDTGSIGQGANLVSEQFCQTLGINPNGIATQSSQLFLAPSEWMGLGGPVQTSGPIELKFFPSNPDRAGKMSESHPIYLKFYIHNGPAMFGDLLLGREYCEIYKPVFRYSIKISKKLTPDQQRSANDIMRYREMHVGEVARENTRRRTGQDVSSSGTQQSPQYNPHQTTESSTRNTMQDHSQKSSQNNSQNYSPNSSVQAQTSSHAASQRPPNPHRRITY